MNSTLKVKGIVKKFPGITALNWNKDDEIVFESGTIYALLGENGAGKSTLSKIIAGIYQRDGGEILLDGEDFNPATSKESRDFGIGIVMQEEGLMTSLKVSENLMACSEKEFSKCGLYSIKKQNELAKDIMKNVCPWIKPNSLVIELNLEDQKMVEIARATRTWPKVFLVDEASAALSKDNTERLFKIVKEAKANGSIVIMVTHRMEEVFAYCDQAVIMKDGKLVGLYPVSEIDIDKVSRLMVGRSISTDRCRIAPEQSDSSVVLEVSDAEYKDRFKKISFSLKKGHILGVAGLNGGGKDELLPALFGEIQLTSGTVKVFGEIYDNIEPKMSIEKGIAYIPKFRDRDGLIINLPISFNILLPMFKKISKKGFLRSSKANKMTESYAKEFMVKCRSVNDSVSSLSGGNRQKVIIARWIANDSKLILVDNPTRGIDVGARAEIYRLLNDLTANGYSVLMVSDDLPEILSMSDEILVIRHGIVSKYYDSAEGLTEHDIVVNMI